MVWNIILLGGTLAKRGGRSATTSSVPWCLQMIIQWDICHVLQVLESIIHGYFIVSHHMWYFNFLCVKFVPHVSIPLVGFTFNDESNLWRWSSRVHWVPRTWVRWTQLQQGKHSGVYWVLGSWWKGIQHGYMARKHKNGFYSKEIGCLVNPFTILLSIFQGKKTGYWTMIPPDTNVDMDTDVGMRVWLCFWNSRMKNTYMVILSTTWNFIFCLKFFIQSINFLLWNISNFSEIIIIYHLF